MIKRNIPFGYTMTSGEIVINEKEAAAVRQIFSLYLHGESLQSIADAMTVSYNEDARWDKHKVKRVLDNTGYIGNGVYPELIKQTDFMSAKRLKAEKNVGIPIPCPQDIQTLKAAAFCHDCGGRFIREVNRHGNAWWCCNNRNCANRIRLRDDTFKTAVIGILKYTVQNPDIMRIRKSHFHISLAVTKLQNEINREMSKAKPDVDNIRGLLLSLAAEKYAACGDTFTDLALRKIFENHEPADQFDCGLFENTVNKVLIAGNGDISLRLKNGQALPEPD